MKRLREIIYLGVGTLTSVSLLAIPFKGAVCSDLNLNYDGGKYKIHFSKDCQNIYVAPPSQGSIEFSGGLGLPNAEECKLVQRHRSNIISDLNEIEEALRQLNEYDDSLVEKYDDLRKAGIRLQKLKEAEISFNGKVKELDLRIRLSQQNLEAVQVDLVTCASPRFCQMLQQEIADLKLEIQFDTEDKLSYQADALLAAIQAETLEKTIQSRIQYYHSQDNDVSTRIAAFDKNLSSIQQKYNQFLEEINQAQGAKYNFTLTSNIHSHVEAFRELNPSYRNNIVALPLNRSEIVFFAKLPGEKMSFPILRELQMAGMKLQGKQEGGFPQIQDRMDVTGENVMRSLVAGQSLTGFAVLSKAGVCSTLEQSQLKPQRLESVVTASMVYEYDEKVERNFKVFESKKYLHEIIHQKKTSKSGLFKTSTLNSLTEKQEGEKYLQIHSDNNDSSFDWSDRERIAKELRKELLDEFIAQYGVSFFAKGAPLTLVDGGKSAAAGAADELDKCKHQYCQYAAIGLRLGDSLFGGSVQTSTFKKTLKNESNIQIRGTKAVKRFDTMSFKVKGN